MTLQAADPLPVKEERLGAWHYLYPMECFGGGGAKRGRYVYAPTAVAFGGRIAVFVPGSDILAEFADGRFEDLKLPGSFSPVSLSVDRNGTLYCLLAKQEEFIKTQDQRTKRWFAAWSEGKWAPPVEIPFAGCDRLAFDSQNRLWALGRARAAAVRSNGAWDTYVYSNDKNLAFLPIRMAENPSGDVVLFSYDKGEFPGQSSRLAGALLYRKGNFVREPEADVSPWCKEEEKQQSAIRDDRDFDRKTGYVCHKRALNGMPNAAATVLRTERHVLVSFGNDGLAWASAADLAAQPPLSDTAEWEAVNDVTVPPTADPAGNLWVGRENPARLITFSKEKTTDVAVDVKASRDNTMDFDQLGRAWVAGWHGSMEREVTVADAGALKKYASYREALKAEAAAFKPGRILPWAVKTPNGDIGSGCGFFGQLVILDSKGEHVFEAGDINPAEPEAAAHASHGYNPFRDSVPWYDKEGRICAEVLGTPFCYAGGKWVAAGKDAKNESALADAAPKEQGDVAGPFQTQVKAADGRTFIFQGFHFYEKKGDRLEQVDSGLNPLAYYPFWTNWYCSPGQTKPSIDPNGRIWISPLGPYAENREWFVLR